MSEEKKQTLESALSEAAAAERSLVLFDAFVRDTYQPGKLMVQITYGSACVGSDVAARSLTAAVAAAEKPLLSEARRGLVYRRQLALQAVQEAMKRSEGIES